MPIEGRSLFFIRSAELASVLVVPGVGSFGMSGSSALVADTVAIVVVNVICRGSVFVALIAICIAGAVVNVVGSNSQLMTVVAISVTCVVVEVANLSCISASVAVGIAGILKTAAVEVLVGSFSGLGAEVALAVAVVRINVRRILSYGSAIVAGSVASVRVGMSVRKSRDTADGAFIRTVIRIGMRSLLASRCFTGVTYDVAIT